MDKVSRIITSFLLGIFLLPFALSAQTFNFTQNPDELRENIQELSSEIEQIEQEIAEYREEVNKIAEEKRTLQNTITTIDTERKKLQADVSVTDKKITKTSLTLTEIKDAMALAEEHINLHRETIAKYFRRMDELDNFSLIEFALSNYQLSEVFQELQDIRNMQGDMRDRIFELRLLRAELAERRSQYQGEQEHLEDLKEEILTKKRLVDKQKKEKDLLLRETQQQESTYQSLIAEREALRRAFEQELFEYESRLKFVLDPTALPPKGQGVLSWPVDEPPLITALFKSRSGPHSGTSFGHSGVDFRGNGDPVYAMADGVVVGVGDTDEACQGASFGKWILIRYDNNLASTYGHLSIISAHKGQRVKRGQLVGYSGSTGRVTAPHLHVTTYAAIDADGNEVVKIEGKESLSCKGKILVQPRAARSAYLNLLDYTVPPSPSMFKAGLNPY